LTFIVKAQIWADRFCNRMNRLITMRPFLWMRRIIMRNRAIT